MTLGSFNYKLFDLNLQMQFNNSMKDIKGGIKASIYWLISRLNKSNKREPKCFHKPSPLSFPIKRFVFEFDSCSLIPPLMNIIIFRLKFNMQKLNYQEFRDEQETEMQNYQTSIPVGQPVMVNAYPQVPLNQAPQFIQQPQQYNPHPGMPAPPPMAFPPQAAFPMAPPQSGQNFNFPVQIQCPCCKMTVPTVVNQESGNTTYLWCGFLFCCVSPLCCCLPFLMDSCLDKTHYCPNCGHVILRKHQKCFEFVGC